MAGPTLVQILIAGRGFIGNQSNMREFSFSVHFSDCNAISGVLKMFAKGAFFAEVGIGVN